MDPLTKGLVIPFAAAFIIQRFLEILDPLTSKLIEDPGWKKVVLGLVSLVMGWALASWLQLGIFHALGSGAVVKLSESLDHFLTGIFISAGTEGFNSLLKFANYKKEESKADAASKKSVAPQAAMRSLNP
jgi:hypothetical protein